MTAKVAGCRDAMVPRLRNSQHEDPDAVVYVERACGGAAAVDAVEGQGASAVAIRKVWMLG
jgi:hypothetical protein